MFGDESTLYILLFPTIKKKRKTTAYHIMAELIGEIHANKRNSVIAIHISVIAVLTGSNKNATTATGSA